MAQEGDEVFMNVEITNADIYKMVKSTKETVDAHTTKLDRIETQVKLTNGRVNTLEGKVKCLEESNIIMFCKKYKIAIIILILLGVFLTGTFSGDSVKGLLDLLK